MSRTKRDVHILSPTYTSDEWVDGLVYLLYYGTTQNVQDMFHLQQEYIQFLQKMELDAYGHIAVEPFGWFYVLNSCDCLLGEDINDVDTPTPLSDDFDEKASLDECYRENVVARIECHRMEIYKDSIYMYGYEKYVGTRVSSLDFSEVFQRYVS